MIPPPTQRASYEVKSNSSALSKARAAVSQLGFRRGVAFVASRLLRVQRHVIYMRNVAEAAGAFGPVADDRVLVLRSAADLSRHSAAIETLPAALNEYWDDVRAEKAFAVLMLVEGEVAHWAFVMKRTRTLCILGAPKGAFLLGNAFTLPQHRRKGLQARSVALRAQLAAAEEASCIVAETSPSNSFSRKGLLRGGLDEMGKLVAIVLLNRFVIRIGREGYRPALIGWCR